MKKLNKYKLFALIALVVVSIAGCKEKVNSPRPIAYFRIDFPEKQYQRFSSDCPFSFDYPTYAFIIEDSLSPCWMDIYFPYNKATIYLTYKSIHNDFNQHMEDSREFVYKHTVKADAIKETFYENEENNVYGILYDIKGNAASSLQFFVTDSTTNFLRGALYFDVAPNKDSLSPVIEYLREDIIQMFESLRWE
jgi:gliding motility-associated lipoprotein GldD